MTSKPDFDLTVDVIRNAASRQGSNVASPHFFKKEAEV